MNRACENKRCPVDIFTDKSTMNNKCPYCTWVGRPLSADFSEELALILDEGSGRDTPGSDTRHLDVTT